MRGEGSGLPSPMAPSGEQSPLLETHGLVKRSEALAANDRVDLAVHAGEMHALLGENGAGKSTLVKMLSGLLQPDAGHILWEGRPTVMAEPRCARQLSIGMVFQHFSLFEAMTVVENIALGLEGSRRDTRAESMESIKNLGVRPLGAPLRAANLDTSVGRPRRARD